MPVYNITVTPDPAFSQEYRIEADSLEDAKDEAIILMTTRDIQLLEFELDGEESDDQDSETDN